MDFRDETCGTSSSKKRLARLSVDKRTDVVLIVYEGKRKKMCEMCGHKVKYFTHFILKAHHEQVMPKRIYRLCGSKDCQSKALKDYMKTYVSTKEGGADGGKQKHERREEEQTVGDTSTGEKASG